MCDIYIDIRMHKGIVYDAYVNVCRSRISIRGISLCIIKVTISSDMVCAVFYDATDCWTRFTGMHLTFNALH